MKLTHKLLVLVGISLGVVSACLGVAGQYETVRRKFVSHSGLAAVRSAQKGEDCGKTPLFDKELSKSVSAFKCADSGPQTTERPSVSPRNHEHHGEHHRHRRNKANRRNKSHRMTNGTRAALGRFPSFARIDILKERNYLYDCGGAIISRNWIVTAAHCLVEGDRIGANAGFTNYTQINQEKPHVQRRVSYERCVHPKYVHPPDFRTESEPYRLHYNLGFIRVEEPFEFTDWVQPVCLSTKMVMSDGAECISASLKHEKWPFRVNDLVENHYGKNCPLKDDEEFKRSLKPDLSCWQKTRKGPEGSMCSGDNGSPMYCIENCNGSPKTYSVGHASYHPVGGCLNRRLPLLYHDYLEAGDQALSEIFDNCQHVKPKRSSLRHRHWTLEAKI